MASDIKAFLIKKTRVRKTKTIPVTLVDGSRAEIDIQSLFGEEIKNIRSKNMRTYPPAEGTGMTATAVDDVDFAVDILLKGVTAPDFSLVELQDHYGATTQRDLVYRMFDLNEIGNISSEIINLGGKQSEITTDGVEPEALRTAKN